MSVPAAAHDLPNDDQIPRISGRWAPQIATGDLLGQKVEVIAHAWTRNITLGCL
jgi:hypothetical protein